MAETTIVTLAFYTTVIVLAIVGSTAVVGGIAFWRTEKGAAKTFSLLLRRASALQLLAVILIILAAVGLRLANSINAEAVVSILSGVAGYVLGGVTATKDKESEQEQT